MTHHDNLKLFTSSFERGEISIKTYREKLEKLFSESDSRTQATIRRRRKRSGWRERKTAGVKKSLR